MKSGSTITVSLKELARPKKARSRAVRLPQGATLADLLAGRAAKPLIVIVNGVPEHDLGRRLSEGDVVALFPPMGGG
jgi:molybdopterin converting factor small subunit